MLALPLGGFPSLTLKDRLALGGFPSLTFKDRLTLALSFLLPLPLGLLLGRFFLGASMIGQRAQIIIGSLVRHHRKRRDDTRPITLLRLRQRAPIGLRGLHPPP